jgi:2-methylcitrate dehydratase PrpD
MAWRDTTDFIHSVSWDRIPSDVQQLMARCLLDLTGTLVAGKRTDLSRIVCDVAVGTFGGDQATLMLDGRRSSAAGAALANGMTIDALDAHDGYRLAKGHAGAGVYPAALAAGERFGWDGEGFLAAMCVGYEIALRAAEALHALAQDYHSSGAWVALGSAAVMARALGLDRGATRHALGIAEYQGPRSEMMRCIDHPTMLKDGSGWGSMTGVVATDLAAAGFTGAPATTVETDSVQSIWEDLGREWRVRELYFKPYACCRWAQPAIDAALTLIAEHDIEVIEIAEIDVFTFEEATRLAVRHPQDTEQAQYSLPFPLAAALMFGGLDPHHVLPPHLDDGSVLELADKVTIHVDPALDGRFPEQALARVRLATTDGRKLETGVIAAKGGSGNPMSDSQITEKFQAAVSRTLLEGRALAIQRACWGCAQLGSIHELISLLAGPPQSQGGLFALRP